MCIKANLCKWIFSLSMPPISLLSLCYSSLINFMMRKVNCRRTQPCPFNIPRVFTFHTITMQKQSKEHALLTNKCIFVSPRSRRACFRCNLEWQTATATAYEVCLRKEVHAAAKFKRLRSHQGVDSVNCLMPHWPFLLLIFTFSHIKWPPSAHIAPTTSTPLTTSKLIFSFWNIKPCKQTSWKTSVVLQKG